MHTSRHDWPVYALAEEFHDGGSEPTEAGEATLNPWHMLGLVKRLEQKPLHTFVKTDKFLYIVRAEEEQLVTSKMEVWCACSFRVLYEEALGTDVAESSYTKHLKKGRQGKSG